MEENKTFTQEELEEKIKDRLARADKKHADELAKKQTEIDTLNNTVKDLNDKIASFDEAKATSTKELDDLKIKLKGYETASVKRKVADELGLGFKALEFIQGETEEEMRTSAKNLKALTGGITPPLASKETPETNKIDEAFRTMNEQLKGN
jgi:predicted  nucleic acid-binding Zn-ribbon protein